MLGKWPMLTLMLCNLLWKSTSTIRTSFFLSFWYGDSFHHIAHPWQKLTIYLILFNFSHLEQPFIFIYKSPHLVLYLIVFPLVLQYFHFQFLCLKTTAVNSHIAIMKNVNANTVEYKGLIGSKVSFRIIVLLSSVRVEFVPVLISTWLVNIVAPMIIETTNANTAIGTESL